MRSKIVLNTPYTFRKVFYNGATGRQVAIASFYSYEPEEEMPHFVEWSDVKVSVPIEGRGAGVSRSRDLRMRKRLHPESALS